MYHMNTKDVFVHVKYKTPNSYKLQSKAIKKHVTYVLSGLPVSSSGWQTPEPAPSLISRSTSSKNRSFDHSWQ